MTNHIIESPVDVLEAAADEIEVNGWTQDAYQKPTGELCIMGAFRKIRSSSSGRVSAFVDDAIDAVYTTLGARHIPYWNDTVCTSEHEAIEMLRQAAKMYQEDNA